VLIAAELLTRRWNHGSLWRHPVRQQPPQLRPGMSGCGSRGPIIIHTSLLLAPLSIYRQLVTGFRSQLLMSPDGSFCQRIPSRSHVRHFVRRAFGHQPSLFRINSTTRYDTVGAPDYGHPLLLFANTSVWLFFDGLTPTVTLMERRGCPSSTASVTPREPANSLLHHPLIFTDLRNSLTRVQVSCQCIATRPVKRKYYISRPARSRLVEPLLGYAAWSWG
jgi:hypothetical protein